MLCRSWLRAKHRDQHRSSGEFSIFRQFKRKSRFSRVQITQTRPRILQSCSCSSLPFAPHTISNPKLQKWFREFTRDFDSSTFSRNRYSMQNRVLHQRLKNQLRHKELIDVRGNIPLHFEATPQPHLL